LTVRLDIFEVKKVWPAMFRIAIDRFMYRLISDDLSFYRLLGTGTGRTFTSRDANFHKWAVLTVWQNIEAAKKFSNNKLLKKWLPNTNIHSTYFLSPLISKGKWAKQEPFGSPVPRRWDGAVLSITRARIKFSMWRRFQREVPPVSKSLHLSAGLLTIFGIGEAPIGLQGTVSIWSSNQALTQFAQREQAHREVINKTHELDWYAEELFARFAVLDAQEDVHGVALSREHKPK
jgi:hypothetical protein